MSSNLPWKARLGCFIMSMITKTCLRKNFTVNRRIWNFIDVKASPSKTPLNGVKCSNIIIDEHRNLWFRVYIPTTNSTVTKTATIPMIFYAHGGGFCLSQANSSAIDAHCQKLVHELHVVVASVNYRLAPEHKYPCHYEDCFDALRFIDANMEHFPPSVDPSRCFLLGDSAGGNLIHHVSVTASEYEFKRLKIVGSMSIQPFFGGEERTASEIRLANAPLLTLENSDWYWKAFLPDE